MTAHDYLKDLKRIAKDCARASGAELHEVQKRAAQAIGFAHWHALARKAKMGWQPTADDIVRVEEILRGEESYLDEGLIGQHPYKLDDVLRDTRMRGRGWCIYIGEAPSSKPQLLITDRRFKNNPIQDPDFVAKALPIAKWKAKQVRAEIARDWPRNSTKPDAEGRAMHPLNHVRSDKWYCMHCDGESSGIQMAHNLWHCPYCGATPLDMLSEPFLTAEQPDVEKTRAAVHTLIQSLDPALIALVGTSRDLEAIVDKQFDWKVRAHRWYAVISRGDHIHAVADIDGRRISLQRYVMKLQYPDRSYDDLKQVSFENKTTFDCRVSNLEHRVGRQAVMRNRRSKRNTSSQYKGVIKALGPEGSPRWRTQIMADHGSMGIGVYEDEHWAATVYDAAAYLLFAGEALYNFPGRPPDQDALLIAATKIARYRAKAKRQKGTTAMQEIPMEVDNST